MDSIVNGIGDVSGAYIAKVFRVAGYIYDKGISAQIIVKVETGVHIKTGPRANRSAGISIMPFIGISEEAMGRICDVLTDLTGLDSWSFRSSGGIYFSGQIDGIEVVMGVFYDCQQWARILEARGLTLKTRVYDSGQVHPHGRNN